VQRRFRDGCAPRPAGIPKRKSTSGASSRRRSSPHAGLNMPYIWRASRSARRRRSEPRVNR
jgi:hypothetical protein